MEQKGPLISFFTERADMMSIAAQLASVPSMRGHITASGGKRAHFSYRLSKGGNGLEEARKVLELYTKLSQNHIDKSE